MLQLLRELRKKVVTGFVSGSDLVKMNEQLAVSGNNGMYVCHNCRIFNRYRSRRDVALLKRDICTAKVAGFRNMQPLHHTGSKLCLWHRLESCERVQAAPA